MELVSPRGLLTRLVLLPAALAGTLLSPPNPPAASGGVSIDTLPLRLRVTAGTLSPRIGRLCRVQLDPAFRYVGGQRFTLLGVADAEQHFFVAADSGGTVRQLYWLQAEELLPDQSGGYDYTADSNRTLGGLPWWLNLRPSVGTSRPGSDRAAAVEYLQARRLRFPELGPRLRLVYVPESRGRREFMIIYLEAASVARADTTLDAVLRRALTGLRLQAC